LLGLLAGHGTKKDAEIWQPVVPVLLRKIGSRRFNHSSQTLIWSKATLLIIELLAWFQIEFGETEIKE